MNWCVDALRPSHQLERGRKLRFLASAMPSISPLSAVQVPERPNPTSEPPNTGLLRDIQ
jgi:hypothetical protein